MEETDYKNKTTSFFNEGVMQLQRLHNIWLDIRKFREAGEFDKAKGGLMSAYVELSPDIESLDLKYGKRKLDSSGIDKTYKIKLNEIDKALDDAASNKKSIIMKKRLDVYNLLIEKEIILRRIQEESGKGAKYKSVDEDELD
jgi:hypothetical protein